MQYLFQATWGAEIKKVEEIVINTLGQPFSSATQMKTLAFVLCPRSEKDFTRQELTREQYFAIVKTGLYPLYYLLLCQAGLLIAWQLTAFVQGFCPLVNPSSFHAVCHTGFWIVIEMVAVSFVQIIFL
jgi:hypothetical protein